MSPHQNVALYLELRELIPGRGDRITSAKVAGEEATLLASDLRELLNENARLRNEVGYLRREVDETNERAGLPAMIWPDGDEEE